MRRLPVLILLILMISSILCGCYNTTRSEDDNHQKELIQYENYTWGLSKEKAIKQVKDNGYKIIRDQTPSLLDEIENNETSLYEAQSILYSDSIFREKAEIQLRFTPKSKKLYSVAITIENKNTIINQLWKDIKSVLIDKYGNPFKLKGSENNYKWEGKNSYIITAKPEGNVKSVTIMYFSDKYMSLFKKEKKEILTRGAKEKF